MDGGSWLWQTAAGMIVGFVAAVGTWSAAAQVGRSACDERRSEGRGEHHL